MNKEASYEETETKIENDKKKSSDSSPKAITGLEDHLSSMHIYVIKQ